MKKNGIALAIILIILVMTLVACGENDLDTCEHNVVIDEAVSATCTEMGLTEGAHCSKCGEVLLAQTEVPALGHTSADAVKENEIAPTCTTAGSYDSVVYCSVCDAELSRETKTADALDHNIVNHNAQAPTCTEVGWNAYETCSRCDYSTYNEIPATGHSPATAVIENDVAPTCTTAGSYDSVVYCSVCDVELSRETKSVDALDHNTVNHNAQAPTCTEIGWEAYETCSRCDYTTYEEIPATGHSPASAVIENNVAPTCTTDGSYDSVVYCSVCDAEISRETKAADALDHNIVNHNAQAPTCTEVGWEAYETCSRCDHTTYVEIPATGHDYEAKVTEPTCTEEGYTTYTCRCGDTYVADEVSATGHNFENNEYCLICSAEYYTEGLQFSLCKDEYTVTGIITSASDVTVPSTYQGLPVTEIATNAFYGNNDMLILKIPASVTTIGSSAFEGCSNLTSVTFGENSKLTTIGNHAFYFCTSLTSIVIPDSVTTIGDRAFRDCHSLTSIVIPDSVTTIGTYAFYNCYSLTSVTIGDSVTSIGELAFSGSNVTDVYYNGDVAGWCGITFGDSSANPMYLADNLYIDGKLVEGELVIPDSVTTIPTNAFQGCAVTSVTFGNESQLTAIDSYAFEFCNRLTSVTIPDGVTSIGNNAFFSCDDLTNVTFGNDSQLLEIGSFAFAFCYSLTSISIPNKVTNIGEAAFKGCTNLKNINVPAGITSIGVEAFRYCDRLKSIFNYSSLDIVAGETTHGYIAEYADRIYDMTGDATLSEDEDGFVLYTKGNVCELVEYKGDATDVVIPDGITAINNRAFYDNDTIAMVFIPASAKSIGDYAFFSCDNLTSVYYNGDVAGWCGITFGDYSANPMHLARYLCIEDRLVEGELVIPDEVTSIPEHAFSGQAITRVTIPDSVTTIGSSAFYNCDSLTSVTFGENSQLTTIGDYAFSDCDSLTSVTIPDNVTSIGTEVFYGCKKLTSISVDENNPNYKSMDGNLYSKDGKTLIQYAMGKSNTTFEIPSGVTTIGDSAFYGCYSLTSITIPDSVTTIDRFAFSGCTSLTSVTIGDSVTTIGECAFSGCTGLTSIVIPDSVTTIDFGAFSNCTSLTEVYYTGTEEQWKAISIDSYNDPLTNATIHYNYVNE